ncbi:DNA-binding transcription repressor [Podila humilis]|nr:DNA-binding transcription repressor [Podila humilis]
MSSGAISLSSTTMNEPRKPVRVSLNRIQDLAVHLSPGDIQLFRQRGILRADSLSTHPSSASTSSPVSRPSPEDSRSNLSTTRLVKPSAAPMTSSTDSLLHHPRLHHDRRHSSHHRMPILPTKQILPPYHSQTFEDTCSHLNPLLGLVRGSLDAQIGFRRHSESSYMTSSPTKPDAPLPSATSKSPRSSLPGIQISHSPASYPDHLSHLRRASMSTTSSPVVPSPLGNRTVLYAASSPAHTLLSLPAKPVSQEPRPNHSTAMNNFKFPADGPSSYDTTLPPSPSSPPTNSALLPASLTQGLTRSKRKSIPHRSPSWTDSQDTSPGVIFQLPFGNPSQSTKSSPALPSSNYPSPASSTQALLESSHAAADIQLFQSEAPTSPMRRNGLGIQVDQSFVEPGATHPLEQAKNQPPSTEEHSNISIGDIIIAEQASMAAAQRQRPMIPLHDEGVQSQGSIPTPPMTSRVFSLQVMETISEQQQQEQDETSLLASLANESTEMNPHTLTLIAGSNALSIPDQKAPMPPTPADDNANREKPVAQVVVVDSDSKQETVDQPGLEDPSLLPLRAQRQLSIRRQSLIPRPELDFVRGSGILPPASKDLRTRGGATILTYPVLLSDMVQVAMDDAANNKGDESSNESPEEAFQDTTTSTSSLAAGVHGKRRKGYGKRRAALMLQGSDDHAHDTGADQMDALDGYASNQEHDHQQARPRARPRRLSPSMAFASYSSKPKSLLGSPIELSEATFSTSKRRGSKSALSRQYEYQPWGEHMDVEMAEETMDYALEQPGDEYSGDDHGSNNYQPHSRHHSQPKKQKQPVLEKLRPAEVELAMQHAREMMRVYDPAGQHAMKTLQPLLDAIQSEDDHEEESPDHHTLEQPKNAKSTKTGIKKLKSANSKKRPIEDASEESPKKARKKLTDANTSGSKRGRKAGTSKKSTSAGHNAGSLNRGSPSSHDESDAHDQGREDGKLASSPVKKREPKIKLFGGRQTAKHCEACGADDTPCWRPGYIGNTVLCNSCGLRYKKSNVFCTKLDCKYIPLKTEYASMEAERIKHDRDHLRCINCKGNVALPIPKS